MAHIDYAKKLKQRIPEELYAAAHSVGPSYLLTLAVILDRSGRGPNIERQMPLVVEHVGSPSARQVRDYHEALVKIGAEYRLPLLELAFPALKRRPNSELVELGELTRRLVAADGDFDLYEFCFYRILLLNIGHVLDPSSATTAQYDTAG